MKIDSESMKTRQELVTDAIRAEILTGRFRPGDRLDQTVIANELQVSRSPVREALRILTAEDLLTHYRHRGTVVAERSIKELEEWLHIRKMLEGSAAQRAAEHMTDARLDTLQGLIREARTITNLQHALELNNRFHTTLYEAYDQPILIGEIQKLRNKIAPYNRLYLDTDGHKKAAWDDHQRIYDACVDRDGERAAHETREHLDRVFRSISASFDDED